MLVGFGVKNHIDDSDADLGRLKELGCERMYLVEDTTELDGELNRVLEFLRPKDVLVVTSLTRLGNDFARLLLVLEKLTALQIDLHAETEGIRPGTLLGESFLVCAAVLSNAARAYADGARGQPARDGKRHRGRPPALSPSQQMKAAKLLEERRASVLEVARMLHVSPATIYRYFPKNRRPARKAVTVASGRDARQR